MRSNAEEREAKRERERMDDIIAQLQYGASAAGSRTNAFIGDSASSPDGVPGVIGVAGGGGAGGCGSGGTGCDVDFDALAPPFRRAIPDQGRTTLLEGGSPSTGEQSPTTRRCSSS